MLENDFVLLHYLYLNNTQHTDVDDQRCITYKNIVHAHCLLLEARTKISIIHNRY